MSTRFRMKAVATLVASTLVTTSAHAYVLPVIDAALNMGVQTVNTTVGGVTAAVNAMNQNLYRVIYEVGTSVNQGTGKIANTVETSARSQRELAVAQARNRLYEDARQRYVVPSSICSESGSGGAAQIAATAGSTKGSVRPRGGAAISDASIAQAINGPAVAPDIDSSRAARIHAQFCDADDFTAYGGAQACPATSTTMPGADKRLDSLFVGAGPNGKIADLTFSQKQIDAALMYIQNGVRRSVSQQLRKGEADTTAGAQYVGLQTQFQAILSAAADPLEQQLADSVPNPVTRALLQEALTSPSANSYYQQVASPQARSTGVMSAREFEAFEVGRRYANTAYQSDLQAMNDQNLTREMIRATALNAWLLKELKDEVRKGNIISGLALASAARQEYEPVLSAKYRAVSGRMGGR